MNCIKCFYRFKTGVYALLILVVFYGTSSYAVAEQHVFRWKIGYAPAFNAFDPPDFRIVAREAQDIARLLPIVNGNLDIRTPIDAEAFSIIFASGNLQRFSISNLAFINDDRSFNEKAFNALLQGLSTTIGLTHIRLWSFDAKHISRIIDAIRSNPNRKKITTFNFVGCDLIETISGIMELGPENLSLASCRGITREAIIEIANAYLLNSSRLRRLNFFFNTEINTDDLSILIDALIRKEQINSLLDFYGEKKLPSMIELYTPRLSCSENVLTMEQFERTSLRALPCIDFCDIRTSRITQQTLVSLMRNLHLTIIRSSGEVNENDPFFDDYSRSNGGMGSIEDIKWLNFHGTQTLLCLIVERNLLIERLARREVMQRNFEALHAMLARNPQGHFATLDVQPPIMIDIGMLPTNVIGAYNIADDQEYYRVLMLADENALYHLDLEQIRIINQIRTIERELIAEGLRLAQNMGIDVAAVPALRARAELLQHMRLLDKKTIVFLKGGAMVYKTIGSLSKN